MLSYCFILFEKCEFMISDIPIVGTLYQWWCDYSKKQELAAATFAFEELINKPKDSKAAPLTQKTLELLEHCKDNPVFKNEMGKLERTYFTYLNKTASPLPLAYLAKENRDLTAVFSKMGISAEFLNTHPEFLSIARKNFWQHYFPLVKLPVFMVGKELFIMFETGENTRKFEWKPWSTVKEFNLDNFRVTYQGFAVGHPDKSKRLVPLKTVDSGNKYALQFITTCPTGRGLPSSIDFQRSGHSFTQIILPRETAPDAEVYSVGYFPRKYSDFGFQIFKTVPGVYRNHDSNVSRIQAKQLIPIVKQYVFEKDSENNPCLFSLVQNMDAVCAALKAKNISFEPITMCQINKAISERNEPELDRILICLTEIREQIVKGSLRVPIQAMDRRKKAQTMIERFEAAQGKHAFRLLGSNCTAVSFQQESFAVAFLDAKLDGDKAVKVYDSQIDIRDHKYGILDRILEVAERILLHFFAALPLTGPILGTGSTHPDANHLKSKRAVPSVLSETAFATHQFLIATFTPRPLFPAGEILAQNTPVIEPPGFLARLKYLWNRHTLLN